MKLRTTLIILFAISLLVVGYIYLKKIQSSSEGGEVVESMHLCDPQEETKMPETFY